MWHVFKNNLAFSDAVSGTHFAFMARLILADMLCKECVVLTWSYLDLRMCVSWLTILERVFRHVLFKRFRLVTFGSPCFFFEELPNWSVTSWNYGLEHVSWPARTFVPSLTAARSLSLGGRVGGNDSHPFSHIFLDFKISTKCFDFDWFQKRPICVDVSFAKTRILGIFLDGGKSLGKFTRPWPSHRPIRIDFHGFCLFYTYPSPRE